MSFRTAALALATAALVVLALLNVRQLWVYRLPTDGVLWQRTTAGLEATAAAPGVNPEGPALGDRLLAVNGAPVDAPEAVARHLAAVGVYGHLRYTVLRGGALLEIPVAVQPAQPALGRYTFLELVGLLYLLMGLFVLYRRQSGSQAIRFYCFCLASFVLYCFHFTGKLNAFDRTIFWCNEAALLITPCLLVHFALRFQAPGRAGRLDWGRWIAPLAYLPAILLGLLEVALATGAIWLPATLSATQAALDRLSYVEFGAYFVLATVLFARKGRSRFVGPEPSARGAAARQARVMGWGTGVAITPFLVLYIVPYLFGADLPRFSNLSVLSLMLVPLAFGYAIWRHRLLEAEIVFRRGVVYTLATAAVVGVYLAVIGLTGILIHSRLPAWGWAGSLLAILVTALLFEPLKRWLQERLDRLFYRDRYDYRRTLMEFGRQLNAEPELEPLMRQMLDRLCQTLSLGRAAIFLATAGGFHLGQAIGLESEGEPELDFLDRRFLDPAQAGERWFLEYPYGESRRLGLHYYLPCRLQDRTVAVLGLGKTTRGEFLTGEDLALVETLAGHCAIALENARLMATLRQKADEYQRLKDFNQNIVESVHVGVIAVSLDGLVESWNTQMETLTGRRREQAIGRPVASLLGTEFAFEFAQAADGGIRSRSKFRLDAETEGGKIVDLAIAPLLTARFERVGQIVLLSDVTAEVELEQRLVQADRLRSVGLLAAGVAHEVNTPLAVISSYTQMLAKQTPSSDPRGAVLDTITQQTFRASEIIANLLNFSRTGSARFRRVDLNAVGRDTLALIEHPLKSAQVHVVASLHPAAVEVMGDAGQLQQVVLNLILNARDAMPRGGTLRVSTGVEPGDSGRAWIEVADTGEGIPPELRHRIFDPFFTTKAPNRLADGRGSLSTGTGLGLAVTYGIVQEHGGAISVHSEPQRGTEFRVHLPHRVAALQAEPVVA